MVEFKNRNAKIRLIQTAKRQLGLDDETYRLILQKTAGVSSAAKITSEGQFSSLISTFKTLGFRYKPKSCKPDELPGFITPRQSAYIKHLWQTVSRSKTDKALNTFIRRVTGIDSFRFLDQKAAREVILALEAMAKQESIPLNKAPRS